MSENPESDEAPKSRKLPKLPKLTLFAPIAWIFRFIAWVFRSIKEAAEGVKIGLKSPDRPTRHMSWLFILFVLGIFCTVGFATQHWTNLRRAKREALEVARKASGAGLDDHSAELAEARKAPVMYNLGQFTIQVVEKPGKTKARGMMNFAEVEIILRCDSKETCGFIEANQVRIRNEITDFFTPIDREELLSSQGKRSLRKALIEKLNLWLPRGKIDDLWFNRLIIS